MKTILTFFVLTLFVQSCQMFDFIERFQFMINDDICPALPDIQPDEAFEGVSIPYIEVDTINYLTTESTEWNTWAETKIVHADLYRAIDSIGGKMYYLEGKILPSQITGAQDTAYCGDLTILKYDGFKVIPMVTHIKKNKYYIEIRKGDNGYEVKGTALLRKSNAH